MLRTRHFQPSVSKGLLITLPQAYHLTRRSFLMMLPALALSGRHSVAATTAAHGLPADPRLIRAGEGTVSAISDGDTVTLASGTIVRLVGIQAPKIALGRRNFAPWPLGQPARDYMTVLAKNRDFALFSGGREYDRHGRLLAHMVREEDGLWLQGEMLRAGLARVYTFADNRALAARMLAIEAAARARRAGIWAHPFYAIRRPGEAGRLIGTFQIFGACTSGFHQQGRSAILTLKDADETGCSTPALATRVSARALRMMSADFRTALTGRGRWLRLRGWVGRQSGARGGPVVTVTHPEQIEWIV